MRTQFISSTSRTARKLSVERVEERIALSVSNVSAFDQLLVELINRGRANPAAEASRYSVDLNQGLAAGTISTAAKEPLAPQQALVNAAGLYSDDMLNRNFFDHVDPEGTLPWDRTEAQGYPQFAGVGENIAWGTFFGSQENAVLTRHDNLFQSPGHRANMLDPDWNEIGTGVTFGTTPYQSVSVSDIPVSIVTENFGGRTNITYLTGVAFDDSVVGNSFYNVGEGLAGVTVTATDTNGNSFATTTATAGGYALQLAPGTYTVTALGNGVNSTFNNVSISNSNVKIDVGLAPAPPAGNIVGESGSVTINQSSANQWHQVSLVNTFTSPIVVMGPASQNDSDPTTIRVRNVTANSFEWQIDEWEYLDGIHAAETIGYMVVEEGTHTLSNGGQLVAGRSTANHLFSSTTFDSFQATPSVFASVVTYNDATAVTTRIRNITNNSFEALLQKQESVYRWHSPETLHFVAIENSQGQIGNLDYIVGNTGNVVSNLGYSVSFSNSFNQTPVLIASTQSFVGGDVAGLRVTVTPNQSSFLVEEEQSANAEVAHISEDVAYFAIDAGNIFATNSVPPNAPPTIQNQTFGLSESASNGSVVGTVIASDPDSLDQLSFSILAGNGNNLFSINGSSGQILVSNSSQLAPGQHNLTIEVRDLANATATATITIDVNADSSAIGESGTVSASQASNVQWHQVNFQRSYSNPIVVMGPLSNNDGSPATVRIRNVTSTGFQWQIDEWNYLDGAHSQESVGYLVIEAGTHQLGGNTIHAGSTTANHWATQVTIPTMSGTPVVLASVASVAGGSAVTTRISNVSSNGFDVRVQEEQGNDFLHAVETINYITIDQGIGSTSGVTFIAGTRPNVANLPRSVSFGSNFQNQPVLIASAQTMNGGDPAGLRHTSLSATEASFFIAEEQSGDSETGHGYEVVGYFAIDAGLINGNSGTLGIRRDAVAAFFEGTSASIDEMESPETSITYLGDILAAIADHVELSFDYSDTNAKDNSESLIDGIVSRNEFDVEILNIIARDLNQNP